jgi:uncharacterized membrane protein YeaQ/YmgE (transglycosylase-associated protein family)
MLALIGWLVYGLVVGLIAKQLHPGDDPKGFLPTIGIGIAGSFIGGFLKWCLGMGHGPFEPSGLIFGIIGGVVFCWLHKRYL